ncbi:MAG: RecX family transcriptional regulator [Alphaproteobacteria bacterium]
MRRVDRAAWAGTVEAGRSRSRRGADRTLSAVRTSSTIDLAAPRRGRSLHRQGASKRAIRAKLAQKGIAADLVEAAITALADVAFEPGDGGVDLAAAVNYARRRRIGPFGHPARRAVRRDRDLAALGRQGFAYDIARRVVDAPDAQAAESLADAAPPVSRRG